VKSTFLSQEVDGIIAICDLIFTAINERLKEHGSATEPEEGTEKTSNALKQISMIANSVGKPGENTVGDRLAAFLDTVKGLQ